MRIAFDLCSWSNRRGFGRYTRSLVRALLGRPSEHEYLLFVDEAATAAELPAGGRPLVVGVPEPASRGLRAGGRRPLAVLSALRRAVATESPDWLVYPSIYSYFPAPRGCRVVVGIPDVIPEEYPRLVFPRLRDRLRWRLKSWAARRRADAVLTISEYARDGLVRRFGLATERLWVVEPAPDPVFRPRPPAMLDGALLARLGLVDGAPVVVYLGGLNPHKNVPALVDAVAELRRRPRLERTRLLCLSAPDDPFTPGREEVEARVRARGLETAVAFPGYLEDDEVAQALQAASVLALPSFAEGYGLPAVEAAACGTPVVATRNSPLPALLGEGGLYVDPQRPEQLVAALAAVLDDAERARRMGAAARERAARMSWEHAAERFLAALEGSAAERA